MENANRFTSTEERDLLDSNALLVTNSRTLVVTTDEQYQEAAEFARTVKTQQKNVKEYFQPMKDAAHKAHAAVCERERELLAPLLTAEKACKDAMSEYIRVKQEEARRQEEELKRAAQAELERQLAEAAKAEASGNLEAADDAISQAIVAEQISETASVVSQSPKVAGVSTSVDYEIVSVNDALVPVDVNGCVIRPVDTKTVMKLIKASKGTIKIPGIVYRETVRMSVSSRRG